MNGGSDSEFQPAELNHVFAAKHLAFSTFKNVNNNDVEVYVRDWVEKTTIAEQDQ